MTTHLVLGGTGKTGSRLTRRLVESGATARPAARAPGQAGPGVEPVRFDWDDETTWSGALDGVTGVYVVPPALRLDHAPLLGRLTEAALAAGASRVVLLSARGVDAAADSPGLVAEQAVQSAAGGRATVLRPTWFMQNFTESFFAPGVAEGQLVAPTGDGAEPFVDVEDIAAVAAAALTDDGHAGQVYELSGPAALTFAQVAAQLSAYAGHEVAHVDLPVEAWKQAAVGQGVPPDYAALLGQLFENIRAGGDARVSAGVEQALGRPATSFEEWAAREAGALRADRPA